MHILEFCEFLEPWQKNISKVRVLRGSEPSHYIVIIKMNSVQEAVEFASANHNKRFNQIEQEVCKIYKLLTASIKSDKNCDEDELLELINTGTGTNQNLYNKVVSHESQVYHDPDILFETERQQSNCPICLEGLSPQIQESSSPPIAISSKQDGLSQSKLQKMKSEKLRGGEDDYTLTILCCHTFHQMCLKNWNDTTCPLCRYLQSPVESSQCDQCSASDIKKLHVIVQQNVQFITSGYA